MEIKKIATIAGVAMLGAGLGAYLSFGPLQKYKAETTINFEMNAEEFKRYAELLDSSENMKAYEVTGTQAKLVNIEDIVKGQWFRPLYKNKKIEYKDLPDALARTEAENTIKREQAAEVELEKLFNKDAWQKRYEYYPYSGIQIISIDRDAVVASERAKWLQKYSQSTSEISIAQIIVERWTKENKLYTEKIPALKSQIDSEFYRLKGSLAQLNKFQEKNTAEIKVEKSTKESNYSPTLAFKRQQLSSELELNDWEIKKQKLLRIQEQQLAIQSLLKDISFKIDDKFRIENLTQLESILRDALHKKNKWSEQEKLNIFLAEVVNANGRVKKLDLKNQQINAERFDRITTIKLIVLSGLFFAILTSLILWRKKIKQILVLNQNSLAIK